MLTPPVGSQHELEIPDPLLPLHREFPSGAGIRLRQHGLPAHLRRHAGALFHGHIFLRLFSQPVDARHLLPAVMGHHSSVHPGTKAQLILLQEMAGIGNSVFFAPCADPAGIGP